MNNLLTAFAENTTISRRKEASFSFFLKLWSDAQRAAGLPAAAGGLLCSVVKYLRFFRCRDGKRLEVARLLLFKKERESEKRQRGRKRALCLPGFQPEVEVSELGRKFTAQENKTCAAGSAVPPSPHTNPPSLSRGRVTCPHATIPPGSASRAHADGRGKRKNKRRGVFFFFFDDSSSEFWADLFGSPRHLPAFSQD